MGKKGNTMTKLIFAAVLLGCALICVLLESFIQSGLPQKIKSFFSSINSFKKKEVSSENKDGAKEYTDFSIPEFGIKGYTGEGLSTGAIISFDPKIQEQLDSMQNQINALSADLFTTEDTLKEAASAIVRLRDRIVKLESEKPAKKKVVKKKYDDHKVHTKAYKNATKAKK